MWYGYRTGIIQVDLTSSTYVILFGGQWVFPVDSPTFGRLFLGMSFNRILPYGSISRYFDT